MKKINLKGLDREAYIETLDNGLDIYMVPLLDKKNYFISYATKFGSDILEFTKDKKKYKPPLGVAHFLEHKMFEQSSGIDPFTYFSNSGTDSNASTSFDSTQYICYGTKNFNDNLDYLLEFVNNPYYTDENVEKEKGIIAEEINMYNDMPDFKLEMTLTEAIYHKHPRRIDIAGTVDEINKITKEDLYACYNSFYIPNNMFILIVGNFDKDDALKIIKNRLNDKKKENLPKIKEIVEDDSVYKKELNIKANVETPKIAIGIKIPTRGLKYSDEELDLYLNILTTILFGASSNFREKARENHLLSNIYLEWESINNFKNFYIMANTDKPNELIEEINKVLKDLNISKDAFERIKKVWISGEVKIYDAVEPVVNNSYDDIIKYNKLIDNRVDMIRDMSFDKLKKIIKNIDFNNKSIVKMTGNKKKKY